MRATSLGGVHHAAGAAAPAAVRFRGVALLPVCEPRVLLLEPLELAAFGERWTACAGSRSPASLCGSGRVTDAAHVGDDTVAHHAGYVEGTLTSPVRDSLTGGAAPELPSTRSRRRHARETSAAGIRPYHHNAHIVTVLLGVTWRSDRSKDCRICRLQTDSIPTRGANTINILCSLLYSISMGPARLLTV